VPFHLGAWRKGSSPFSTNDRVAEGEIRLRPSELGLSDLVISLSQKLGTTSQAPCLAGVAEVGRISQSESIKEGL